LTGSFSRFAEVNEGRFDLAPQDVGAVDELLTPLHESLRGREGRLDSRA